MSTIFKWDRKEMDNLLATCETDGIFPYIEKYMPAPSRVLESGCGAGRYVKYLHDRGWDVVGLEWDKDAIDMVKEHWPDVKTVQGDCADSPFKADYFDGIISLGVIEHWTDGPHAPLHDIYRTLKPGAAAIITAPCLNTVRKTKKALWWNELVTSRKDTKAWLKKTGEKPNRLKKEYKYWPYPTYGEFFEYRFTKKQFLDAIAEEGFEIVEHAPIAVIDGLYHELNPGQRFIKYKNRQFYPTKTGNIMHRLLSPMPFVYTHHQLAIVRKPKKKSKKFTKNSA